MDVTCDNCKAEYDFDDTLLGDKGTTVKCSKCGHVFRVLPPRREPQRSALKVRYRDGRIESIASLRELQQRIQAGTVGMDDELGRDGFTFRRLGDVPELKNFFGRTAPASGPIATGANAGPLPHRGEPLPPTPKRTIMGVGNVDVPAAPRVPNFGPMAAAQALAPTQPAASHPKNTVQGRAPISSAPTAPNMAIPAPEKRREAPSQRMPVGTGPSATGTAPTMPASPSFNPGAFSTKPPAAGGPPTGSVPIPSSPTPRVPTPGAHGAPISNAPTPRPGAYGAALQAGMPASTQPSVPTPSVTVPASNFAGGAASSTQPAPAQRPAGRALRLPDSSSELPLRSPPPSRPQGMGLDSIAPGMLKAAVSPSGNPGMPQAAGPMQLSLDEDEPRRPDGRGTGSSSKLWLYALLLVALGGAGWVIAGQLKPSAPATVAPVSATQPPAASPAPALPDAAPALEAPAEAPAVAAAEPQAPAAAAALEPAPEPAKSEPAAAAGSKPETGKAEARPTSAATAGDPAGREPKDYSGWVGRGDKLLKQGDFPGAQQAFEQAVALRGTGSEANSGLGAALLAQGQTREAIPFLTRASSNGFAEASVGLGDAYRKLGQKEAAIEAYETYLARLPKGARASYVRLQLEGLGQDVSPAKPAPGESAPAQDGYRPAGELTQPGETSP